jgi:bud emergence protein 1
LATKPGDTQTGIEPRAADMDTLLGPEAHNTGMEGDVNQARYHLGQMNEVLSDGSDYEDEGYGQSPQRPQHPYASRIDTIDRRPSVDLQSKTSLRKPGHAQNHERQRSNSPASIPSPQYGSNSRSESPFAQAQSGYNRWVEPAPNSAATSQHSGRSRSHSNAATNLNSPPISAANPQTAFVKIKIFDRVADDLIAIRVHPLVSLAELLDKVQGRLGGEVANLKYRDSMHRGFVDLDGDDALRQWIETTDKHVLYAD